MVDRTIIPIAEDPLFALPDAGDAIAYILPRDGESISKCQDFYAVDAVNHRYAVTDGVSTSFAPRAWASIIARSIVHAEPVWRDFATFDAWLSDQASAWHDWMTQRWLPTIHALQTQRGERLEDYTTQIDEKGAQTTLICAALSPGNAAAAILVEVLAIGDAEAFHVVPQDGNWHLRQAFPLVTTAAFGVQPTILATIAQEQWRLRAWQLRQTQTFTAQAGDRLLLASDTLAEWILHEPDDRIAVLLGLSDAHAFDRLIEQAREAGQMKDDDITLLIIPVHEFMPPAPVEKDTTDE